MTAQCLDRTLHAYRIGDPDGHYPIYDATGSTIAPGRWNDAHTPVIYAAEHYSTAMLEKLAHLGGLMPPNQHFVEIELRAGLSFEIVTKDTLAGWADADRRASKQYGCDWAASVRTLVLIVPSYVARMEHNLILNPRHPDFADIKPSLPAPIWWDERLFA